MADDPTIRRIRDGDLDAFASLVGEHREAVHRLAARLVGPHDADDVAQDTFLRAFNGIARFRGDAAVRTWLLQIAHNTALNHLARKRPTPVADVPEPDPREPADRTPADHLESAERSERLLAKIGRLRPEYQAVVLLRDVEGLSYDEIAELVGTPVGTVKTRVHRARAQLIDALQRNTYDWNLPTP